MVVTLYFAFSCVLYFEMEIFNLSFLSDDLLEDSDSEEHSRSDSVTGM